MIPWDQSLRLMIRDEVECHSVTPVVSSGTTRDCNDTESSALIMLFRRYQDNNNISVIFPHIHQNCYTVVIQHKSRLRNTLGIYTTLLLQFLLTSPPAARRNVIKTYHYSVECNQDWAWPVSGDWKLPVENAPTTVYRIVAANAAIQL